MKAEIAKKSAALPSFPAPVAMASTATTGQLNAIRAKYPSGNFHGLKTAASFASGIFIRANFCGLAHALAKFSASAIAFRIAMDLLTVS